ncbi:sulfotransferase [Pilimelia columellifera subsp. columellifera]|uniref:Sulfotransferase n=2 Tax=Pilimelia TaxID=53370 RepID=A0ABP6B2W4_9ACTN
MLSRALNAHPSVLCLSEFFASLRNRAFPVEPLDGAQFWQLLSAPDKAVDAMVRNGLRTPEQVYPYETGRFGGSRGVPAIRHMTLPALSDDPDALYDELEAEIPSWPHRPIGEHYRDLYSWFAQRFGRRVVVERSGASLLFVHRLRKMFPEARFVHMFRDGADCALSMSRHFGFRLMVLPRVAARIVGAPANGLLKNSAAALPAEFQRLFRLDFSEEALMGVDIPLWEFGEFWSTMIQQGVQELAGLGGEARLDLRYEDLLADPRAKFTALASYIGVDADAQWLDQVSGLIEPSRVGAAGQLDRSVRDELRTACAPGELALSSL